MVTIKRIDKPLTFVLLNDIARSSPVVYVIFSYPGVDVTIRELFSSAEAGEILIVAEYELAGEVTRRFGAVTNESMLGFAIHTFTGLATQQSQYQSVIRDTRDWRHRQRKAEEAEFNNVT